MTAESGGGPRTPIPLSSGQRGLWLAEQLADRPGLYNTALRFSLDGDLDPERLRAALRRVVGRHAALRTGFDAEGRGVAGEGTDLAWSVEDPGHASAERLAERQRALAAHPLAFDRPPLLRATLFRQGPGRRELLLVLHHAVFDGASIPVLMADLALFYRGGEADGEPAQMPELARRRESALTADRRAELEAHWDRQLAGELPLLALPADRPRPTMPSHRGATASRRLDAGLSADLASFCRSRRVTPFMALLAVYGVWLCRHAGQEEAVVGAPVSLRRDEAQMGAIGYLVETVPLRLDYAAERSLAGTLPAVRALCLSAFRNADLRFAELAARHGDPTRRGAPPLVQAMLTVQPRQPTADLAPGLAMAYRGELPLDRARFDVSLVFDSLADGQHLALEYAADLFDAGTAERMLDRLVTLLAAALADPDAAVGELPLMPAAEREEVSAWSGSEVAALGETSFPERFAARVAEGPDAVAVRHHDRSWTRGDLDRRGEALALAFRRRGIEPGDRIALCLPRSPEQIAAALACWKAGAAYVPIDPALPTARRRFLCEDARVALVVAPRALASAFRGIEAPVVGIEELAQPGVGPAELPGADPRATAYILYTSGSSGEPKGVEVEHRAAARLLSDPGSLGYAPGMVMLQSINPAFDASLLETWGPLCCGGSLVLHPEQSADPGTFGALVERHAIDTATMPASFLEAWSESWTGPSGLARIVVGGEALSPDTVERVYRLDDKVVLFNHYGPTENGILSSCRAVPRDFERPISIGRPVAGTRLLVLDERGALQPPGVVGEIHAAGIGLARGYFGRGDLTEKAFPRADPSLVEGERWYRTGDLGRWRAAGGTGLLEFAGRADGQVKIRGYRIELGEIETRLRSLPGVRDARADAVADERGARRLVAYVVADEDRGGEWRDALARTLPPYMVPRAIVRLDAWPLTANGKLDRRALPVPDRADFAARDYEAPRPGTEADLAAIWTALLGIERIGAGDDFFELGGHSLLVARLQGLVESRLGRRAPALRELFAARTLRGQAAVIETMEEIAASVEPAVERPGGPAPLTAIQRRLWLLHQLDPSSGQYNVPWHIELRGELDTAALESALGDVAARHEALRSTFVEIDGEPRRSAAGDAPFVLPTVHAEGRDALEAIDEEGLRPFDLAREAPMRALLVRLGPRHHYLALTFHHIAVDAGSIGILVRDLERFYAARARGERPSLDIPAGPFVAGARRPEEAGGGQRERAYWQSRLDGVPAVHDLPLDHPRGARPGDRGDLVTRRIDAATLARIDALARAHRATRFLVLHALFAVLLSRWSGQDDVVVGTPLARRKDPRLEQVVGLYIDMLVLRSDLSGAPTFARFLARSVEATLADLEHADLPFDELVERHAGGRDGRYSPLFQVLFSLQDGPTAVPDLGDLRVAALPVSRRAAKFDLTLNLVPTGDGLVAEWELARDLFATESIASMASSFDVLLAAAVADPHTPIAELPLLDEAGRAAILTLGEGPARDYPDVPLHRLVERRARATPDAPALTFAGRHLSYRDLEAGAGRVARHLVAAGVEPGAPVAIAMARGPELVAGLLGILRAGAVITALDPALPPLRLASILDDCAPPVVLVDDARRALVEGAVGECAAARPRLLDPSAAVPESAPGEAPDALPPRRPEGSTPGAYLTYTSGSTGAPKGVLNEHRGIVNRLLWLQERHPLTAGDAFVQTAALGFDIALVEIFWPLLAGARLVLPRDDEARDMTRLTALVREQGVTQLHFVPALLQVFLDHPDGGRCVSLERVFCGGDRVPAALARRFRAAFPAVELHQLYGPSETAVLATEHDCADGEPVDPLPIGRPGANTRIYLLDDRGAPVPRGMRGEIHIAGRQVARGYLRRPELTAACFTLDPFRPGDRMYRSGDIARFRSDGLLEFLGRRDHQLKVRGQRVELGDIESHLLECPGVSAAAVVARGVDGDTRLTAYLAGDGADLIRRARAHLEARLPGHMVPSDFARLDALPMGANGKIDRAALAGASAAAAPASAPRGDIVEPASELERRLAAIWRALLGREDVGTTCDFFAAGGHSLLALRLANRVHEELAFALPLKAFFEAPTIAALAAAIGARGAAEAARASFEQAGDLETIEL